METAQVDHVLQEKSNQKRSVEEGLGISMPSAVLVHAELEMTSPGDSDEQEADAVADSIIHGGIIARSVSTGHPGTGIVLPSRFGSQLASMQGHGSRLYGDLKTIMENGFGRDFSDVRIHTDDAAASMSDSISARAFTYGNDIYFNRGRYRPDTRDGQHLIAHELTHVVQGTGKASRKEGSPDDIPKSNPSLSKIKRRKLAPVFKHAASDSLDLQDRLLPKRIKDDARRLDLYHTMVRGFINISRQTLEKAVSSTGRMPVNVAVRMSMKADNEAGFLDGDYYGNLGKEENNLIVLQEMDSISQCTQLLSLIDEVIGPIQNLIVSGHGQSGSIRFDSDHSWSIKDGKKKDVNATRDFFKTVGRLMPEEEGKTKKIVFDSCLTATHVGGEGNITEFAQDIVGWENKNNIIGGKANLDANIKFSFNDGMLSVRDEGPGMSRLSSDTEYYVGPGATEPAGHIRGIGDKFLKSKNVLALNADLAYFASHVQWRKLSGEELQLPDVERKALENKREEARKEAVTDFLFLKEDIIRYGNFFNPLHIIDHLRGNGTDDDERSMKDILSAISDQVNSLAGHDWPLFVQMISEDVSSDPIPWDVSLDEIVQLTSVL